MLSSQTPPAAGCVNIQECLGEHPDHPRTIPAAALPPVPAVGWGCHTLLSLEVTLPSLGHLWLLQESNQGTAPRADLFPGRQNNFLFCWIWALEINTHLWPCVWREM